jgi:hypothetical protein
VYVIHVVCFCLSAAGEKEEEGWEG